MEGFSAAFPSKPFIYCHQRSFLARPLTNPLILLEIIRSSVREIRRAGCRLIDRRLGPLCIKHKQSATAAAAVVLRSLLNAAQPVGKQDIIAAIKSLLEQRCILI